MAGCPVSIKNRTVVPSSTLSGVHARHCLSIATIYTPYNRYMSLPVYPYASVNPSLTSLVLRRQHLKFILTRLPPVIVMGSLNRRSNEQGGILVTKKVSSMLAPLTFTSNLGDLRLLWFCT
ncbi:hypothetical protein Zmor_012208 [Zophobas morio]|uniref:Uncharacterized protein n=1 Tax=Zophobas morio TaxID=2755281 RepID=A0AA38HGG3_9CUCU|nr:hypothetical protein Zmor_012208 [Zophobas morio]